VADRFTIELQVPKLSTDLGAELDLPKLLEQEMLNVRARIAADTVAGKTADGGGLKPYSRSYIEAIDTGRIKGKAPGNHTPNLTATGQLLRSMQIETSGNEVRMFFQGSHSKPERVKKEHAKRKREAAKKKGHVLQTRKNASAEIKALRAQKAANNRARAKFNAFVGGSPTPTGTGGTPGAAATPRTP
jgi:hypothetical protein